MPRSKIIIAAGSRFLRARTTESTRQTDHIPATKADVAEMHAASLELMWATETDDLQTAIEVFLAVPT
jgi:hypothetical protein